MSKKGQDNQKGINFQNKVALLYMLDNFRYAHFKEIRFEGKDLSDFTLFFTHPFNHSTVFHNFEVKDWISPLNIRKIIKKEAEKGIDRYSEKGRFFIVAPSFKPDCKKIESFKNNYFFNSKKDFEETKKLYQTIYGDHPLLNWSEEEILLLKYVHLVELKEENINNRVMDQFRYKDSFFYNENNRENIISRFLHKITEKSSDGSSLSRGAIQSILTEFHKAETTKSESYNPEKDFGEVIKNINTKFKTEDNFATLNEDRYITPLSSRPNAVFYITDQLKQKKFRLEKIKWFIDKILIKELYCFQCINLIDSYWDTNNLTKEDIDFILKIIFEIYEKNSSWVSGKGMVFKFLNQILKSEHSEILKSFKEKIIKFLENSLSDWQKESENQYLKMYNEGSIPHLIEKLFGYNREGLDFIFKKYNFTSLGQNPCDDYTEEFINKDFKKNFPLVIEKLSNQFQELYKGYGYGSDFYKGYEIAGGSCWSFGGSMNLDVLPLEFVLYRCICKFYEQNKDWKYLHPFIYSDVDKKILFL